MSDLKAGSLLALFDSYVDHLHCVSCGGRYLPTKVAYTCPACGPDIGILDVVFNLDRVGGVFTHSDLSEGPWNQWRYAPLLPVAVHHLAEGWPVGWTPIIEAPVLARRIGLYRLRIKDEGRNPWGSIRDRASSIAAVRAAENGARGIACASSGASALSMAASAALTAMPAYVFVPASDDGAHFDALRLFGATVVRVDGDETDAVRLCMHACDAFGWYNRMAAYNPYLIEGKKAAAYEIAEQCWADPPDWVVVSLGHGCTAAALAKGFEQMAGLGIIDWTPRIIGVQSEAVRPVVDAFETNAPPEPYPDCPEIGSINCSRPRNWRKAAAAIKKSQGTVTAVSNDAIHQAVRDLASCAGIWTETGSAAALAGLAKAVQEGWIKPNHSVVLCLAGGSTAAGRLKGNLAGRIVDVPADPEALAEALKRT